MDPIYAHPNEPKPYNWRAIVAAFRTRAENWKSEGETGQIVSSELNTVLDAMAELLEANQKP